MYNYDYERSTLLRNIKVILEKYDEISSSEILFLEEIKNILMGYDESLEFNNKVYVDKDYYYANNCVSLKDVFDILIVNWTLGDFCELNNCSTFVEKQLKLISDNTLELKNLKVVTSLRQLNLDFVDKRTNENISCFFGKDENGNLFVVDDCKNKEDIEKLLPFIRTSLEEYYSYCMSFKFIDSNKVKSVNSKFLVDFSSLTVYFSDIQDFVLEYEKSLIEPMCNFRFDSNIIKNIVESKSEIISDNIFVKIEDCPQALQKELQDKVDLRNSIITFSEIKREKNKQQEVKKEEQPKSLAKRLFSRLRRK